jgi:hypothetical protein
MTPRRARTLIPLALPIVAALLAGCTGAAKAPVHNTYDASGSHVQLNAEVTCKAGEQVRWLWRYRIHGVSNDLGWTNVPSTYYTGTCGNDASIPDLESPEVTTLAPWSSYDSQICGGTANSSGQWSDGCYGPDTTGDRQGDLNTFVTFTTAGDPSGYHWKRVFGLPVHWASTTQPREVDFADCTSTPAFQQALTHLPSWNVTGELDVQDVPCETTTTTPPTDEVKVSDPDLGANGVLAYTYTPGYYVSRDSSGNPTAVHFDAVDDQYRPYIQINTHYLDTYSQACWQQAVLHEAGHALGLTHRDGTIMSSLISCDQTTPTQTDIDALAADYNHTDSFNSTNPQPTNPTEAGRRGSAAARGSDASDRRVSSAPVNVPALAAGESKTILTGPTETLTMTAHAGGRMSDVYTDYVSPRAVRAAHPALFRSSRR